MTLLTAQQIQTLYQQGSTQLKSGDLAGAEATFTRLITQAPKLAEAHFRLAQIARARRDIPSALTHIETALSLKPQEPAILTLAAQVFADADLPDKALATHDACIALDPKAVKPQADKAHYLQNLGQFSDAATILRKLVRKHPYDGALHRMLVNGETIRKGDPVIAQMQKALRHPKISEAGKLHLGYALAKAMEDAGRTDQVFKYLNLANKIQGKQHPWDGPARQAERTAYLQAQARMPAVQPPDAPDLVPIFVTGMPRSGTTLVEQIIAAHPDVRAGGEMGHALRCATRRFAQGSRLRPLETLDAKDLTGLAQDYQTCLQQEIGGSAPFVTDKSINSELAFGYIKAAIPNARYVIVTRDPRDIALSIYKNFFTLGTHTYANSLADIAEMIAAFQRATTIWRERFGPDLIEMAYEDLVAAPEPQTRALIASLGLPWDDSCLSFHQRTGVVKTLSVAQVRQPIHAGRKAAWERYADDMQPFLEAWETVKP